MVADKTNPGQLIVHAGSDSGCVFPSFPSTNHRYGHLQSCCLPSPNVQGRAHAIPFVLHHNIVPQLDPGSFLLAQVTKASVLMETEGLNIRLISMYSADICELLNYMNNGRLFL